MTRVGTAPRVPGRRLAGHPDQSGVGGQVGEARAGPVDLEHRSHRVVAGLEHGAPRLPQVGPAGQGGQLGPEGGHLVVVEHTPQVHEPVGVEGVQRPGVEGPVVGAAPHHRLGPGHQAGHVGDAGGVRVSRRWRGVGAVGVVPLRCPPGPG